MLDRRRRRLRAKALYDEYETRERIRRELSPHRIYREKVFVIGRHKTGTTSMEQLLRAYGYRTAPPRKANELVADRLASRDDLEFWPAIFGYIDRFEAFQDTPFAASWFVPALYREYPTARYILTTRDPTEWFVSLVNHHFTRLGIEYDPATVGTTPLGPAELERIRDWDHIAPGYSYGAQVYEYGLTSDDQLYDRELYIEAFRAHNDLCRETIPAEHLLEIDLSEHADTGAICDFLGLPTSCAQPLPHLNRRR